MAYNLFAPTSSLAGPSASSKFLEGLSSASPLAPQTPKGGGTMAPTVSAPSALPDYKTYTPAPYMEDQGGFSEMALASEALDDNTLSQLQFDINQNASIDEIKQAYPEISGNEQLVSQLYHDLSKGATAEQIKQAYPELFGRSAGTQTPSPSLYVGPETSGVKPQENSWLNNPVTRAAGNVLHAVGDVGAGATNLLSKQLTSGYNLVTGENETAPQFNNPYEALKAEWTGKVQPEVKQTKAWQDALQMGAGLSTTAMNAYFPVVSSTFNVAGETETGKKVLEIPGAGAVIGTVIGAISRSPTMMAKGFAMGATPDVVSVLVDNYAPESMDEETKGDIKTLVSNSLLGGAGKLMGGEAKIAKDIKAGLTKTTPANEAAMRTKADLAASRIGSSDKTLSRETIQQVVSDSSLKNVKDYSTLEKKLTEKIDANQSKIDATYAVNERPVPKTQMETTVSGKTGKTTSVNFVERALSDLEGVGTEGVKADVAYYRQRMNSNQLTPLEIDKIAKLHGEYKSAFDSKGNEKLSRQQYEETRRGVKDVARSLLPDETARLLDIENSKIIDVRDAIRKSDQAYKQAEAKIKNSSMPRRVVEAALAALNTATFGAISGIRSAVMGLAGESRTMNVYELGQNFAKDLQTIQKFAEKFPKTPEAQASYTKKFIEQQKLLPSPSGKPTGDFTQKPVSNLPTAGTTAKQQPEVTGKSKIIRPTGYKTIKRP